MNKIKYNQKKSYSEKCKIILILLALFLVTSYSALYSESRSKNGMVVSSEKLATQVGVEILKNGGNAVDAAVAVGFALAVTYPTAGNLGGGGFMVIHFPDGNATTIDFRETAPLKAHRDMYLNENGEIIRGKSTLGYLACGVPGSVAGLTKALDKYGTKKLSEVMAPALKLAKKGFPVSYSFYKDLKRLKSTFQKFPASANVFIKNDSVVYEVGEIFKQPDLYKTLKLISKKGSSAFYNGKISDLIVRDMQKNGGIISKDDLIKYRAIERVPVKSTYRDYEIISMGPPSSGGIAIIQCLNILEQFNLKEVGFNSSGYIHLLSEILRNVFAVRAHYLGDSDFVKVATDNLTSKQFAFNLNQKINHNRATPSDSLRITNPFHVEGNHTTHYNVVDQTGLAVAVTTTINSGYGAKAVVEGTGFLLNNEMNDFAVKTGAPNLYGLVAFKPNIIEPGKRMLSSMSPTIICKDGKFIMAVGAMGGPKIITSTLQTIVNVLDFEMTLQEAINAPRIHHQWYPDKISTEKIRIPNDVLQNLKKMGHKIDKMGYHSEVTAIKWDDKSGYFIGAPDIRWSGAANGY